MWSRYKVFRCPPVQLNRLSINRDCLGVELLYLEVGVWPRTRQNLQKPCFTCRKTSCVPSIRLITHLCCLSDLLITLHGDGSVTLPIPLMRWVISSVWITNEVKKLWSERTEANHLLQRSVPFTAELSSVVSHSQGWRRMGVYFFNKTKLNC